MSTFRDLLKAIAPQWLTQRWGSRFLHAYGLELDALAEQARQGTLARFPSRAARDALTAIGNDRNILQGWDEPAATYARRLAEAFTTWQTAGMAEAVARQVQALFYPATPVVHVIHEDHMVPSDHRPSWLTLAADGTVTRYSDAAQDGLWDWDGTERWARCWCVVMVDDDLLPRRRWGDGWFWGANTAWGTSSPVAIATIKRAIDLFRSGGTAWTLILSYDPTWPSTGDVPPDPRYPDGTWGQPWEIDGGVSVASRYEDGLYTWWIGAP